jgi:tetratricopeptide (TPR) repeat protein
VTVTLREQAREALRLAEANPAKSAAMARTIADQARQSHDLAPLSIAERALGMAALQLKDPDAALEHLRAAIRLGRRTGSAELVAEARMGLAFALVVRGRGRQALREIETAIQLSGGVARARVQAQRGAIFQQLGRFDDALPDYRATLSVLRDAGDLVWVQRVLYNRAVLYGYLQEFAAAEADLHEAAQLCTQLELDLSLGFVHQNLGWINALRGDVPTALQYLDRAERCLRVHGAPVGELLADRCQLLLSVRLLSEATQAAEEAVVEFEQQRRKTGLPEARLLLAQAAILDGQASRGLQQARMAVREFGHQRRPRWATLARFTVVRARLADGRQSGAAHGVGVRELEHLADDLAAAGWLGSTLDARLLTGQLALERGWTSRARAQLQQASRHRTRGPALQRAQAWYAEALHRRASGDRRGAAVAARDALRVMDEHRAGMGATDLRAHASGHRFEVAEFGLRMAFDSGRPARVLEWAEQGRASHLMLRPVSPPGDPDLAAALSELRATVSEIFRLRGLGASTGPLQRRQVALERQIRDHYRRLPPERAPGTTRTLPVRTLAGSLGDAALVEFVQLDGTLHAVTVIGGRVRLRQLGPAAQAYELIDRAHFALHRLARHNAGDARTAAARALLAHTAERLDALLMRPASGEAADRPLVVVPTGPLQSLPWSVLPSCAGRPVTVTPSAALWHAGLSDGRLSGHAMVAAGPGLPGAAAEAAEIAALHRVTALAGTTATVEAVTAQLDGAKLAHLAAHGHIHPNNPLFTSLTFADGPLTVYDLKQLRQAPQLVVLAACDVGRSTVRIGDELLGLSATFLALGTGQVVASVVPVPDAETAPLMIAFHRFLAAGEPAAHALALAQQQLGGTHPAATAAAAGFVSIGTGASAACVLCRGRSCRIGHPQQAPEAAQRDSALEGDVLRLYQVKTPFLLVGELIGGRVDR